MRKPLLLLLPLGLALAACSQSDQANLSNTAENTGDALENLASDTGDVLENAADDTGDAIENGANDIGEGAENVGRAVTNEVDR